MSKEYPIPYLHYLVHFHCSRDYYECHEVLEEYWKKQGMKERVWVGLIQLAVALYHHRRRNWSGAFKLITSAIEILSTETLQPLGLDQQKLVEMMRGRGEEIIRETPYRSFDLPVNDPGILKEALQLCEQWRGEWGGAQAERDQFVLDKHLIRDRSSIRLERKKKLQSRRERRME